MFSQKFASARTENDFYYHTSSMVKEVICHVALISQDLFSKTSPRFSPGNVPWYVTQLISSLIMIEDEATQKHPNFIGMVSIVLRTSFVRFSYTLMLYENEPHFKDTMHIVLMEIMHLK